MSINMDHPLIQDLASKLSVNELKRLCNLLSKSLPISTIQSQSATTISYNNKELESMMDSMYTSLLEKNLDKIEIKKKMAKMEPFKEHINLLIDFFDKKEN